MLSITDQVKQFVAKMPAQFTLDQVMRLADELTREQVRKALGRINYVTTLGNGKYSVRGRQVM